MSEMDYSKTLNLPKTDFSMRAGLPQKEPVMVKKWDEEHLYERMLEKNEGFTCSTMARRMQTPIFILARR